MIKHLVLIVDGIDDETSDDIQKILDHLPVVNGTNIIISDSVDSTINVLRTISAKGSMN